MCWLHHNKDKHADKYTMLKFYTRLCKIVNYLNVIEMYTKESRGHKFTMFDYKT